jgi:hypothetical protein
MELLFCPDGLLVLAVLLAALVFGWLNRRRRASHKLLLAGSAALFCGALSTALVFTQVAVFVANRIVEGTDVVAKIAWAKKIVILGIPYDMRLYGVMLLAAVVLVPAVQCIRSAGALAAGDKVRWKTVVRANLLLLAISVPLLPLQTFAPLIAVSAFLSLEIAFVARGDLSAFSQRRLRRRVPASKAHQFDSVHAG